MKEFPTAAMDGLTKTITALFCLMVVASPFILNFMTDGEVPGTVTLLVPVLLVAALVAAYLLKPKLLVGSGNIYIKNYFTAIRIPVSELEGIRRFEQVGLQIRLFGVGGVFGYFGYFNGTDLWYVTNIRKKVKIKSRKRLYVVSPEDPEKFIEEINSIRQNFKK